MKLGDLPVIGVLWKASVHFYRDDGLDRAAAVAFYSLLSLGPLLYLLGHAAEWLLPGSAGVEAALARGAAFLPPEVAPIAKRLGESLKATEGLLWLALPGLLWISTTAFTALEYAVNVAYGTVPLRRFWLSRLKAFAVVSAAAILMLFFHTANPVMVWLARYSENAGLPPVVGPWTSRAAYGLQLLVTFTAFAAFYKILPRGRVGWRSSGTAALIALVLWEITRELFGNFFLRSPSFGLLKGALASIVAFLLWIYAGAAIILYGAEIGSVLNGNRDVDPGPARSGSGRP